MDTRARRSPLRILAPVAIVVFGIAFVLIVATGGTSGGGGGGPSASAAQKARDLGTSRGRRKGSRTGTTTTTTPTTTTETTSQGVYIVKQGDTLGKIAQETGVSVQTLQDLNPGLDQFSLVAGQKIKLR
jgi:LysM repeat protein